MKKTLILFILIFIFSGSLHIAAARSPRLADSVENSPRNVRVLLDKNVSSKNIFIYGRVKILSEFININISQGSIRFTMIDEKNAEIAAHGRSAQLALPCTLTFSSIANVFSYDDKEYRGNIIFIGSKSGASIINLIDVEDYLRGVVPMEIGVRSEVDFEALKAQAIAARTYALSKVLRNTDKEFDLLPTVSDQVYGGVNCEYTISDSAIKDTRGIILLKNDGALLETFYHSTCAGRTASVDEVWNSAPDRSLVSRKDLRPNGAAFCGNSNAYTWREVWSINQFSQILRKYSVQHNETPFNGTVRAISVTSRTQSGRVNNLAVVSEGGVFNYGKDRVRFVLRRPTKDESILKSANFEIKIEGDNVIATGFGFGHGIGMCQTGALGRARAGQSYSDILKSYYSNFRFSTWDDVIFKSTFSF